MTLKCRLCLQDDSVLTSVSDYYERLPISVIMMIICPVTITTDDNLPKFICEECLEVVISAYKLRSVSSKNELFLRSISDEQQPETIISSKRILHELLPEPKEPITIVKSEQQHKTIISSNQILHELSPEPREPITIVKSEIFSDDEESVEAEYAVPIMVEDNSFSPDLAIKLGLEKTFKIIRKASVSSTDIGVCSLVNAQRQYVRKSFKQRHIRKHMKEGSKVKNVTASDEPGYYPFFMAVDKDVRIACGKPYDRSSKVSFVWEYFGKLVDVTGKIIEEAVGWNYCRLCLESKNRTEKRFNASCSTTALHRHLRNRHGLSEKAGEIGPTKRRVKKIKVVTKESTGDSSDVIKTAKASTSSSSFLQINEHDLDSHQEIL